MTFRVLSPSSIAESLKNHGYSVYSITWRLFEHRWPSEASKQGGGKRTCEAGFRDAIGSRFSPWRNTASFLGVYRRTTSSARFRLAAAKLPSEENARGLEREVRGLRGKLRESDHCSYMTMV